MVIIMMKKIKLCTAITVIALFTSTFSAPFSAAVQKTVESAGKASYTAVSLKGWNATALNENSGDIAAAITEVNGSRTVTLPFTAAESGTVAFSAEASKSGEYNILVNYRISGKENREPQYELSFNNKTLTVGLPVLWSDETKTYEQDMNGNEIVPHQICVSEYISDFLIDSGDIGADRLSVKLESGNNSFVLKALSGEIEIKEISFIKPRNTDTYEEYRKSISEKQGVNNLLTVEGENHTLKSESYIRSGLSKNAAVTPHKSGKKCVALLDGGSWSSAGQKVLWDFSVEKSGLYELAFRCSQSSNAGKPIFRKIEIDGITPFAELESVTFPVTGTNEYENYTLCGKDGKPFEIYLEEGSHTISMQVTLGGFREVYDEIISIMSEINSVGMDLKKLSAGSVDANRTWDMDVVMPDAIPRLKAASERIDSVYKKLCDLSDSGATFADSLEYASSLLKKLLAKPRVLPNKLELLNVGDNSVTKFLGDVLSQLISSPLSIDKIYFNSGKTLPSGKAGFFTVLFESISEFFGTFAKDYNTYSAEPDGELEVWVNRSVQYTETMQSLLDDTFNKENRTNIRLSIMPSEQKLILANASGTNPDIAMGVGYSTPFNFAIRNSAKNLLEYEDFLSFYTSCYNSEALTPVCYNDGVYGVIETQNFNVLFYRKDIFESLGIGVPDTWEDVKYLMPTLLRHQMNFYIPLSGAAGYKSFPVTTPFIFQNGAKILSDDGFSVDYRSAECKKAFHEMTELYTVYGMQQSVPSLYNSFRYGEIPIAIGDMGLYLQLTYAAPELSGLWDIALTPGTDKNGETVRWQSADSTACMIFKSTKKSDMAWKFLKWWLSDDIQSEYAQLLTGTYGPEYFWSTANLKAFAELPLPENHKKVILKQWEWQKEVMYHPANYMIERDISNIWTNIVVNGMEFSDAVDNAVVSSDREILRKLLEFGYCDERGTKIKDYTTNSDKILYANK